MLYPVTHTTVPVGPAIDHNLPSSLLRIHTAVGLKGVPVKMVEYTVQFIRRLVAVFQLLLPGKPVGFDIHIDIHHIFYRLLPVTGLGRRNQK